jgi:hypothetical protein
MTMVRVIRCGALRLNRKGQVVTKPTRRSPLPDAKAPRSSASKILITPAIPPEVRALLGPPPITGDEDGEAYAQLEVGLADAIHPTDAIEWIWLKDLVDLIWDARRLRRAKAAILAVGRARSMQQLLAEQMRQWSDDTFNDLIAGVLLPVLERQGVELPQELRTAITDAGVRADKEAAKMAAEEAIEPLTIESKTYQQCLPDLERLDRLITVADVRRDTVLRDLYRRREMLARQSGASPSAQVIYAEFEG